MQRLVSTMLKREGFRVDIFLTGREAIAAIDTTPYDVLLLDLMMPHEGGLTVVRHLESKSPKTLKRAIVLTASPDSVVDSVRETVAGIVHKPFEPPELIETVRRIATAS